MKASNFVKKTMMFTVIVLIIIGIVNASAITNTIMKLGDNLVQLTNILGSQSCTGSDKFTGFLNGVFTCDDEIDGNLDMRGFNVTNLTLLRFDLPGVGDNSGAEGYVSWNTEDKTLNIGTGLGATLQVNQEMNFKGVNKEGQQINNGQVVYVSSSQGNRPVISLARADDASTSRVIGLATHDIIDNAEGIVTVFGLVRDLDTSMFSVNDTVYLSSTQAGNLTNTPPAFPNFRVLIGTILTSHSTQGILFLHPGVDFTDGITVNELYIITNITTGKIKSDDWTNVSITEDQISDLVHTVDTNVNDMQFTGTTTKTFTIEQDDQSNLTATFIDNTNSSQDMIDTINITTAKFSIFVNNSDFLDALDSTQFLRSGVNDTLSAFYIYKNGSNPPSANYLVNKEYVDSVTSGLNFDFFYTNQTSDITGYYNMTEIDASGEESSIITSTFGISTGNIIGNFSSIVGEPEFNLLVAGVFDSHVHLFKTGSKTVVVYWKLYRRNSTDELLILESINSDELTTSDVEYDIHGSLMNDVFLVSGDRLVVKWFFDISGGGSNTGVTFTMEGTTVSRFEVKVESQAFNDIFVRRGDWTSHDDYPAACSEQFVSAIGDTLTCGTPTDTTYTADEITLTLAGTVFSSLWGFLSNFTNNVFYITNDTRNKTAEDLICVGCVSDDEAINDLTISSTTDITTTGNVNLTGLDCMYFNNSNCAGVCMNTTGCMFIMACDGSKLGVGGGC